MKSWYNSQIAPYCYFQVNKMKVFLGGGAEMSPHRPPYNHGKWKLYSPPPPPPLNLKSWIHPWYYITQNAATVPTDVPLNSILSQPLMYRHSATLHVQWMAVTLYSPKFLQVKFLSFDNIQLFCDKIVAFTKNDHTRDYHFWK